MGEVLSRMHFVCVPIAHQPEQCRTHYTRATATAGVRQVQHHLVRSAQHKGQLPSTAKQPRSSAAAASHDATDLRFQMFVRLFFLTRNPEANTRRCCGFDWGGCGTLSSSMEGCASTSSAFSSAGATHITSLPTTAELNQRTFGHNRQCRQSSLTQCLETHTASVGHVPRRPPPC